MKKLSIILSSLIALGALIYFLVSANLRTIVVSVVGIPEASQTSDQQKTLASLSLINDHPFYQMAYSGDYSQFLELKKKYYWAMGIPRPHCSTFAALNPAGGAVLGYNSDGEHRPLLLLFADPGDGYASVSIVNIGEAFGFTGNLTPFSSAQDKSLLLYSPYYINTGMNEMGLAFGVMADPEGKSTIDPSKETTFASEIRRYFLDYAKDVDEAITLMAKYNVSFNNTLASNILLADRSGHSALVEWVDGNMVVIHNQEPWQMSTNFRVYGSQAKIEAYTAEYQASGTIREDLWGKNYWRYIKGLETLQGASGHLTTNQAMELLQTISLVASPPSVLYDTQYSVVYDLNSGDFQIVTDRLYTQVYRYHLSMK